jgi:ZIP family zinc transporter
MPGWAQAGGWGLVSGSALIIGALIAYFAPVPSRIVAFIMSFGSGVLISALSFELMEEGFARGGMLPTVVGFLVGAIVYTIANVWLVGYGAKHRKRSGMQQPSNANSGTAIALGALLDGVPESVVIGVSLLGGCGVSRTAVIAIFLSNIPEGLSSAAGMRKAGRSALFIFGLWTAIAAISGVAALLGYVVVCYVGGGNLGLKIVAVANAVAAGAILSMVADTMIPEAFEANHDYAGLVTVIGFLIAFGPSHFDAAPAGRKACGEAFPNGLGDAPATLRRH